MLRRRGHGRARGGIEATIDEAGGDSCGGCRARQQGRIAAVGEFQCEAVQVDAVYSQVEVGKLRGHARVEFDDRQAVRCGVEEELHVEQAMVETDCGEKALRYVDGADTRRVRQAAGIDEAPETLGARIHLGMDDTQWPQFAPVQIAVEVVLQPVCGPFQQHAVGAAGLGQTQLADALEGFDQVADHPQLPGTEADQGVELGTVAHRARQHRKGGLHRLDEHWVGNVVGHRFAVARGHQFEAGVGFGRDFLKYPTCMQLVLAGQHGIHRCPRPAHAFGQHGGSKCAELFVVGRHRLPPGARRFPREPVDEARQIEAGQARVARKTE